MGDPTEMAYQYRLALIMWRGFESGLRKALPSIRNRSQLAAFRNGPWRQLGESLDRLRTLASAEDRKASVGIDAFIQLCDHLDKSPTVPPHMFTEIFKAVNKLEGRRE